MPLVEFTLSVKIDGQHLEGFPLRRTKQIDEMQRFGPYEQAGQGDTTTFLAVPADKIDSVQVLLLQTDQAITLRIDNQTDRGVRLSAGGLIFVLDFTADQGAGANNLKANNPAAAAVIAAIKGLVGGT